MAWMPVCGYVKSTLSEFDIAFELVRYWMRGVCNFRNGMKEFIESFLRSGGPLNHTGHPTYGADRKSEHGDIHNEFCNGAVIHPGLVLDHVPATDQYGKKGAQANEQAHGREINGFHFCQVNGVFLVLLTIILKKIEHGFFLSQMI